MERLQASFKRLSSIGLPPNRSNSGGTSTNDEKPSNSKTGETSDGSEKVVVGRPGISGPSQRGVGERPTEDERFVVIGRSDINGLQDGPYYRYRSLPTEKSFRVLELLPGTKEEQIQVELKTVSWDSPPAYEPISYRWGDKNDVQECTCDGKPLMITKSLYSALVHYRNVKTRRILWADAVW